MGGRTSPRIPPSRCLPSRDSIGLTEGIPHHGHLPAHFPFTPRLQAITGDRSGLVRLASRSRRAAQGPGKSRVPQPGPRGEVGDTALGGYSLIRAADLDAAVAVAKTCPGLESGMTVEVGEVTNSDDSFDAWLAAHPSG